MMKLKRLLERHPVPTYFILVYAIAWGGILLLIGPSGLEPAATRPMHVGLLVFGAMLLGPSLSGAALWVLVAIVVISQRHLPRTLQPQTGKSY